MKLRRLHLVSATALSLMAMAGFGSQAHAGAYAFATIQTTAFQLSIGGTEVDSTQFSVLSTTNSQTASATLNGVTVNGSPATPGNGVIQQACQGTGCPLGTPFVVQGSPTPTTGSFTGTFAQAATQLTGTIITIGGVGPGGAAGNTAAQTQITGNNTTQTSPGNIQLNAGFVFSVAGTGSTTIDVTFNALAKLLAGLDAQGTASQASIGFEIKVTCAQATCGTLTNGQTLFDWSPNGNTATDHTGGTVTKDPFALNNTINENFKSQENSSNNALDAFAGSFTVIDGVQYNFNITQFSAVNATSVAAVPEPKSLALLAIGLLGLGFAVRRLRRRNS